MKKSLEKLSVLWCHKLAFKLKTPKHHFKLYHILNAVKKNLGKLSVLWCQALAFELKAPFQGVSYFNVVILYTYNDDVCVGA